MGANTATVNQSNPVDWAAEAKKKGALAPDLTDATLKGAKFSELARLMSGKGRKSTFLTGGMGDASEMGTFGKTKLGGY